jgi:hypothetical protein
MWHVNRLWSWKPKYSEKYVLNIDLSYKRINQQLSFEDCWRWCVTIITDCPMCHFFKSHHFEFISISILRGQNSVKTPLTLGPIGERDQCYASPYCILSPEEGNTTSFRNTVSWKPGVVESEHLKWIWRCRFRRFNAEFYPLTERGRTEMHIRGMVRALSANIARGWCFGSGTTSFPLHDRQMIGRQTRRPVGRDQAICR